MPENHTPTPWRIDRPEPNTLWIAATEVAVVAVIEKDDCCSDWHAVDEANAAFIVQAVNAHDALVALLPGLLRAQDFVNKCDHLRDCARMQREPEPCDCYADDASFTLGEIIKLLKAATCGTLADYTQERTILISAIAYALGHPGTPESVSEKLRAALDSTLGTDPA